MTSSQRIIAVLIVALALAAATTFATSVSATPASPSAALLQCGGYLERLARDKAGQEQAHYHRLARRFVRAGNALGDFAGMPETEQRRRFELGRAVYDSDVKEDFARKCPVFEPLVDRTMEALQDTREQPAGSGAL
ncbi:MAG: hypothetical protein IPM60_12945 [Rhodospirillales bacterium]|nr:hypothetical protein [Rhodospirillales bacterium]